jgi:hypothetical protein
MALFTPAESTTAYLKMGLLGFQGSGKTKTATKVAIGLVQHLRKLAVPEGDKPVFFLDTETGSDWVMPDFEAAGIPLAVSKTRAFSDLVEGVKVAQRQASVLLIDSASHFWTELCQAYAHRKAKSFNRANYRLGISDWAYLKGEDGWGKFATLFVNSSLHIILAGRAGYEFDMDVDDEGNKELLKTGVKMKAEGEFGYEPSLLVYMELRQKLKGRKVAEQWRDATVLKDRAAVIDGKVFRDPGFADFLPHVERLALGGRQLGIDQSRVTKDLVLPDSFDNRSTQRKIVLDEIESLIVIHHPGQAAADKKAKAELLRTHFRAFWKEMESVMPLDRLRAGYDTLHLALEGKHSRYCPARFAETSTSGQPAVSQRSTHPTPEMTDELPEHPAPGLDDGIPPFLRRTAQPPKDASTLRQAGVRAPELAPCDPDKPFNQAEYVAALAAE